MPTPTSPSISQNEANYLTSSELLNIYENYKEDIDTTRYLRYGRNQLGIQQLFSELGMTRSASKAATYGHFEQDWRDEIVKVDSGYSTGGATTTFTVASAYNYSYPPATQTIYNTSSTSYGITPREGDVMELGSSGIQVKVTSVTDGATSTFAVECMQTGETIPSGLNTEELFILGRAEEEGGSTPENRETRDIKYENKMHFISEGYKVTGTTMMSQSYVNATNGRPYYFVQGILDTRFRFEDACDSILFAGKKLTSTSATFNSTITTEGLIPFIRNYGNEEGYTTGSWSLQDLENMSLNIGENLGAEENMLVTSRPLQTEIDNILRTSEGLKGGGVSYDKMADFGFQAVTYGGVTYY